MKQKKPFFLTTLWVLMGRAGGFLVPFLIAMLMGASPATDAFFFAYSLIFALVNIFSHIFESSLVPFIAQPKEGKDDSVAFTLKALSLGLPVSFLVSLALGLLLPVILSFSSSVDPETAGLTVQLYRELLPGLLIAVLVSGYQGFFYARKEFWFPSISPIVRTLTMTVVFVLFRKSLGIHSLTLGFVAGEIFRWAAAHYLLMKQKDVRLVFPGGSFQKVFHFFHQAIFQILALVAVNIMPVADQSVAATLGPGNISLFNYADRIMQVPYLLFFYGFTQIFFSFWSESILKEGHALFFSKVQKDIRGVLSWGTFLVAVLWLLAEPLMRLVFIYSHLTGPQLDQLADIFRWLAIGFLPGILRVLYGRVLIILKESKFYFIQSWLELLIKVILNIILVSWFGIVGLAMATAAVYALTTIWLYFFVEGKKKIYIKGES